jgi:uncharacterized tellurite resistance protein B-like protein
MLARLRQFFEREIAPGVRNGDGHALQLATAALLLEMARQDEHVSATERGAVFTAVRERFNLECAEADALIQLAEDEARNATDYFQFTSLINEHVEHTQKIRLVEALWRVAAADQQVHHYEEHMVRRIAELLYLSHGEFIAAKHRALDL